MKLKSLEFRGQLQADQGSGSMASFFANPAAGSDWTYVPAIAGLGLLNKDLRMPMAGTFLTADSPSVPKPQDFALLSLKIRAPNLFQDGLLTAEVRGGIDQDFDFLVTDRTQSRTISFMRGPTVHSGAGDHRVIEQIIPRGTPWPKNADVRLMVGLYPFQLQ
ncbi:MAG TPA: hypothetical protein VE954_16540 [Oligoflexus sp.]|uniref:hypothetical protein n=1 Tax=Oligoflexus sp. TaxID=1971216 RepID=UPI002D364133|nr:hypothetical protein [Oligoflexus sp.]HYX34707.1 hypothetical protein [Oligoflexus sp.]